MHMAKIKTCDMGDCYYNEKSHCHAQAINVGDDYPMCDTYMHSDTHGGDLKSDGKVGSCKVHDCMHNKHMCCDAREIVMHHQHYQVDCMTCKLK